MSFSVKFLNDPVPTGWLQHGEKGDLAQITIGDFSERIVVKTNFWSRADYIKQWVEALERLVEGSEDATSLLVTEMYEPTNPRYGVMVWPLYREGGIVRIQNKYLISNGHPLPIKLDNLYGYIEPRQTISQDGDKVSEWEVSLSDLKGWLSELRRA